MCQSFTFVFRNDVRFAKWTTDVTDWWFSVELFGWALSQAISANIDAIPIDFGSLPYSVKQTFANAKEIHQLFDTFLRPVTEVL